MAAPIHMNDRTHTQSRGYFLLQVTPANSEMVLCSQESSATEDEIESTGAASVSDDFSSEGDQSELWHLPPQNFFIYP